VILNIAGIIFILAYMFFVAYICIKLMYAISWILEPMIEGLIGTIIYLLQRK